MSFHVFGLNVTLFQIIATILGIGILVFVHELGHFMMAKKFKIRVEKFTFGFGPEIVGFTYGETRYAICWIPLGGMVKMPGENIDEATGNPGEFMSQPWYRRLIIAFFGPFMNYLFALVIFTAVIYHWGVAQPTNQPVIGEVIAEYPAAAAGLKAGDRVLQINGAPVRNWEEMADRIHKSPDTEVKLLVSRDSSTFPASLTPKKDPTTGIGLVGIAPEMRIEKVGIIKSVDLSGRMVIFQSVFTLKYLGEKLIRWEKPDVAGPIGVVKILAKAAESGWQTLLNLLAVISVALGLFNLLPIPLVDGGHIFMSLIEGIIRRPIDRRIMQAANVVGLVIILAIFTFATYSDLTRPGPG